MMTTTVVIVIVTATDMDEIVMEEAGNQTGGIGEVHRPPEVVAVDTLPVPLGEDDLLRPKALVEVPTDPILEENTTDKLTLVDQLLGGNSLR
jgi:hypothetical protein